MQDLLLNPKFRAVDSSGNPLSGGKLYTYVVGTTTPKTTYSDHAKTSANANPVILDALGEAVVIPADSGGYKLLLKDSSDATVTGWPIDNVYGMLGPILVSVYANETAVKAGSGTTDCEIGLDQATGNRYTWDDDNSKWRIQPGNVYATDPSASDFTIEDNTIIMNSTSDALKRWDAVGTSWVNVVAESFTASSAPGAIFNRPTFTWSSATTITISPFAMHHKGTTEQTVFSDASAITFVFGSGGSNGGSTNLAGDDWYYLYLDDSAIDDDGDGEIEADNLIALTEEPVWDETAHAWIGQTDSNDRCIGAFRTDGGDLVHFHHSGDYMLYYEEIEDLAPIDIDDTWTDVTLTLPKFARSAMVGFLNGGYNTDFFYRPNGVTSASEGHLIGNQSKNVNSVRVITDSSHVIELKSDVPSTGTIAAYTSGYFFPNGM